MHRATRVRLTLFLAVMAWLMVLPPAYAYIDGGSLSVIFQSLVAGFAALGTAMVVFWGRIKAFFTRRKRAAETAQTDRPTEKV